MPIRGARRTLNDDLSLRRAEAVALMLEKAGVPQDRLVIEGHGSSESASPRGDLDAYAFDRRVTVRLQGVAVAQSEGSGPDGGGCALGGHNSRVG